MMVIVFFGVYLIGNPIDILISPDASLQEIEDTKIRFGFDRPIHVQFLQFVGNAVQGDLGRSFVHGESAVKLILHLHAGHAGVGDAGSGLRYRDWACHWASMQAIAPNNGKARRSLTGTIFGFSLPNFWVGMLVHLILFCVSAMAPFDRSWRDSGDFGYSPLGICTRWPEIYVVTGAHVGFV